jgi:hypothetical protein
MQRLLELDKVPRTRDIQTLVETAMIEATEDIKKLFTLNVDIKHLVTNDLNAPDRIFGEIAKKLKELGYKLVHTSDLEEVAQVTEMEV